MTPGSFPIEGLVAICVAAASALGYVAFTQLNATRELGDKTKENIAHTQLGTKKMLGDLVDRWATGPMASVWRLPNPSPETISWWEDDVKEVIGACAPHYEHCRVVRCHMRFLRLYERLFQVVLVGPAASILVLAALSLKKPVPYQMMACYTITAAVFVGFVGWVAYGISRAKLETLISND